MRQKNYLLACLLSVGLAAPAITSCSSSADNGGSGGNPGAGGNQTGAGGNQTGAGGNQTGAGGNQSGAGGGVGGPCTITTSSTNNLISDMEETAETSWFQSSDCLTGSWYTSTDKTGTVAPAEGSAFTYATTGCHTGKCAKVAATGFVANTSSTSYTNWGWQMGVALNSPSETAAYTVDASAKSGITFWIKSDTLTSVNVQLASSCSTPSSRPGGACSATAAAAGKCDIHYMKQNITISSTWTQVDIPWANFTMPSWGDTTCPAPEGQILNINFAHNNSNTYTGMTTPLPLDGDFWVDDLSFME